MPAHAPRRCGADPAVDFDLPSAQALRRLHRVWATAAATRAWLVTTPGSPGAALLARLLPHARPRTRAGRQRWPVRALSMERLIALERLARAA